MVKKSITILIFILILSMQSFAKDDFKILDEGQNELSVDLGTIDECAPHTIEKFNRSFLYGDNTEGYFLIKQHFEIGRGCFEGYHPQNVSVSAYPMNSFGSISQNAIWQFETTGIKGEVGRYPLSGLYIVQELGCCGAGAINKYYSLKNGNLLAYSSEDILVATLASTSERRFLGVEDNIAASQSYDGKHVAVIYYSDTNCIKQKLVVVKPDDSESWYVDHVELLENSSSNRQLTIFNQQEFSGFMLSMRFLCQCEQKPINISIPVFNDTLNFGSAIIESSSKVRNMSVNHNNLLH